MEDESTRLAELEAEIASLKRQLADQAKMIAHYRKGRLISSPLRNEPAGTVYEKLSNPGGPPTNLQEENPPEHESRPHLPLHKYPALPPLDAETLKDIYRLLKFRSVEYSGPELPPENSGGGPC